MAVIQVSHVQVRRGYLQDLGHLSSGELGWAIDRRKLFIGNGSIAEGAPVEGMTEIMTSESLLQFYTGSTGSTGSSGLLNFPYRFKGSLSGYDAKTGLTLSSPTIRDLQDKVDDHVNVRDFGAVGDGATDDLPAIQRAIDEIYDRLSLQTDPETRRVINFHPGIYRIYGELRVPPYCVLRGTGKDGAVIQQGNSSATTLIKLTDSVGSNDIAMTTNGGIGPGLVEISNITFETIHSGDITMVYIESASNVLLYRCRFKGPITLPNTNIFQSCVKISSYFFPTKSIFLVECDFYATSIGVRIYDGFELNHIIVDRCTFSDHVQAVLANTLKSWSIMGLKITNCLFDRIQREAIITVPPIAGVTSTLNTYLNVGTNYLSTVANIANYSNIVPISSVISFGGNASYSFGDSFLRPGDVDFILPTIRHRSSEIISIEPSSFMKLGSSYQTIGRSVIVSSGSVNYVPLPGRFLSGIIHYSIERLNRYRSGTINYTVDPNTYIVNYRESYTETIPTNIILEMEFSDLFVPGVKKPILIITSGGIGYDPSIITYDIKSQDFKDLIDDVILQPPISSPL